MKTHEVEEGNTIS